MKEAGYATAIIGKWHLGHLQRAYLPTMRGFDRQYGPYNGAVDYFTHERDGGHDWHRDDKASYDEGYSTHLLANEAPRCVGSIDARKGFAARGDSAELDAEYRSDSVGGWKLVLNGGRSRDAVDEIESGKSPTKEVERVELFNLVNDPYEKQNLSEQKQEKVKELRARYNKLAAQATPAKLEPKPAEFSQAR